MRYILFTFYLLFSLFYYFKTEIGRKAVTSLASVVLVIFAFGLFFVGHLLAFQVSKKKHKKKKKMIEIRD